MPTRWLKRSFVLLILVLTLTANLARAFDYGIRILEKKEIAQLTDEALKEAYIDALIEVEAAKVFHIKAGFTPRDYQQFKDLIRYRVNLLFELQDRKMEIPKIEP